MNQGLQPGKHLDADQLNAFAEGALSASEREQCVDHLAGCGHCRGVLFLAQSELAEPMTQPQRQPVVRSWWPWLSAAGLAFACALTVMVVARSRRPIKPMLPDVAVVAPQPRFAPLPQLTPEASPPRETEETAAAVSHRPAADRSRGLPQSALPSRDDAAEVRALPLNGRSFAALVPFPQKKAAEQQTEVRGEEANALAPDHAQATASTQPTSQMAMRAERDRGASGGISDGLNAPLRSQASEAPQLSGVLQGSAAGSEVGIAQQQAGLTIEAGHGPANGLASLDGVVSDATGAVVPGANIAVRQMDGSANSRTIANARGTFNFSSLPVGRYELTITAPGFLSEKRELQLGSRDLAVIQSQLAARASSETVEVSSAAVTLSTADRSSGSVLASEGQTWVSQVVHGDRTLALNSVGKLFLRRTGKRWKAVKPEWSGTVTRLMEGSIPAASADAEVDKDEGKAVQPSAAFQVVTDKGEVWTSLDGTHWQRR